jgi:putative oxidoreductase
MNEARLDSHRPLDRIGTTILRTGLGAVFLAHGLAKVLVYTIPGTAQFFESVGFPGFLAIPVMAAELVGGTALLAGVLTRWAALAMVPIALGATSVHWSNGWVFNAPGGGWEFTALLALFSLALFAYGDDGRYSFGTALRARRSAVSGRASVARTPA